MLKLEMILAQALRQDLLVELTGGWTTSIFPAVEHWLEDDTDHWRALAFIGTKKSMECYRSVVDYIYAQVFPERRKEVFKFYLSGNEDDMAKAHITVEQRALMEAKMMVAVEVAYQLWCEKRSAGWGTVRAIIEEFAA